MNVEVAEISPCQKKLSISLSREEVNKEYQAVIRDLRKNVTIPGFRKGKASISTLKRKFRREIAREVKEKLLERSFHDALIEHDIRPIGKPSWDIKSIKVAENKPVDYDVEVEYIPLDEVTHYKGVEITRPATPEVTEESIKQTIETLRRQNAVHEPVDDDHVVVEGDSVTIDYQRFLNGEPLGDPLENYSFWLGNDPVIPELQDNIFGKKKGETFTFSVQYNDDYGDAEVAGKSVDFQVEVVDIENVMLPEVDDEFAKDVGEETLDSLKEQIRQSIRERLERDIVADTKNRILFKIAESYDFAVPPSLLNEQKKQYPDKEEEDLLKTLRAGIIMGRIQQQEEINVSETEIDETVYRIAMQHQVPVAAMRNYLEEQGGLDRIRSDIAENKALDLLYEHAQITTEDA